MTDQQATALPPLRQFLGKINGFADKRESNFYGKMLKAYLQGHDQFRIGRNPDSGEPVYGPVMQKYNIRKKPVKKV